MLVKGAVSQVVKHRDLLVAKMSIDGLVLSRQGIFRRNVLVLVWSSP